MKPESLNLRAEEETRARDMKTVTLNEQEAGLVLSAIDAAVRAGGTRAAVVLVPVALRIEEQLALPSVQCSVGAEAPQGAEEKRED